MAFPWIFASNFESGSNADWDSESDTGSLLDFPHYSVLASLPWSQAAPYSGAYCMRVRMGDTNDHTLTEADIAIAADTGRYASFMLYLAPNVTATADDTFQILELQQAGGTVEAVVGLRITASTNAVEIGCGETAPTAFATATLDRNRWYHVELFADLDAGGGNDGSLTLYLDGVSVATVSSLDQGAVGKGVLGTQDTLSTTTGTLLFDDFVFDDAQVYPRRERFPLDVTPTKSTHVFVGPGAVQFGALLSTTAGNTMKLYDTDTANVNDAQGLVADLDYDAGRVSIEGPLYFTRGCYVQLSGTNPRGSVQLLRSVDGPRFYSAQGIRHYGQNRRARANNV